MRLIDADKLKMCYTGTNGYDDKAEYFSIRKMIDLQPTAYDVDKVVERLELLAENAENNALNTYEEKAAYGTAYSKAIEAVKAGGANE